MYYQPPEDKEGYTKSQLASKAWKNLTRADKEPYLKMNEDDKKRRKA